MVQEAENTIDRLEALETKNPKQLLQKVDKELFPSQNEQLFQEKELINQTDLIAKLKISTDENSENLKAEKILEEEESKTGLIQEKYQELGEQRSDFTPEDISNEEASKAFN